MKETLRIFSPETEIRKSGNTVKCTWKDDEGNAMKQSIPIERLVGIEIYGNMMISSPLLQKMNEIEVPCTFNSFHGKPIGTFFPAARKNPSTKIAQIKSYIDKKKKLEIASRMVEKAVGERILMIKKRQDGGKNPDIIDESLDRLSSIKKILSKSKTLNELRGHEGNAMKTFFVSFESLLKHMKFDKRTRQPPENEINSLLGYANVTLYNLVNGEVFRSFLDPTVGFLHEINGSRNSLALDIAEMFRPVLVDDVILRMERKREINKSHFNRNEFSCYLNQEGKRKWFESFNSRLSRTRFHDDLNRHVSVQEQVRFQCYRLIKFLNGETKRYETMEFNNWR
jgi:CRISPR-associated protein Cas1